MTNNNEKIWDPGPEIKWAELEKLLANKKDYKGPLYAPHPDIKKEAEEKEIDMYFGSEYEEGIDYD